MFSPKATNPTAENRQENSRPQTEAKEEKKPEDTDDFKVENREEPEKAEDSITDGFKIGGVKPENEKFKNLKFGDDYDISKDNDDEDDGQVKTGFFRKKM